MVYKWHFFILILPRLLFAQEIVASELYKQNGLWGVGTASKPVTPAVYDTLISFKDASYFIATKHRSNGQINNTGVITGKGKIIVPYEYLKISPDNNGLIVSQWVNGEERYGVLSLTNETILNTRFKHISHIQSNWVVTTQNGETKLYTLDGKIISTLNADSVTSTDNPIYLFTFDKGKEGLISTSGLELSSPKFKTIFQNESHWEATAFPTWKLIYSTDTLNISADSLRLWDAKTFIVGYRGNFHVEKDEIQLGNTYSYILPSEYRLAVTRNNDNYGAITIEGKELLSTEFQKVVISKGYLFAKKESRWSLYDSLGNRRSVFYYDSISNSSEGLYPIKRKGKWGFMNRNGIETIHCIYDSIATFKDNKSIISYFGKEGIINKQGAWEVKPVYDEITGYNYEYYIAKMDKQYYVKNYSGDIYYFSSNPIFEQNGDFFMYSDKVLKELIINNSDSSVEEKTLPQDWRIINVDGKYGFESMDGILTVTYRYDSLLPYQENLAAFKLRGKWGFIDRNELIVVQPAYNEVSSFKDGKSIVKKDGKYGVVNSKGEVIIKPRFDALSAINSHTWLASENNLKGLYNQSGEVILHPTFDAITYINNNLIIVSSRGKYGIVDQHGFNILPRVYDYIGYDKLYNVLLLKKDPEKTIRIN